MTIKEFIEQQLALCVKEHWFPDDDSKKEGYVLGLEEVLEFVKEGTNE